MRILQEAGQRASRAEERAPQRAQNQFMQQMTDTIAMRAPMVQQMMATGGAVANQPTSVSLADIERAASILDAQPVRRRNRVG